MRKNMYNKMIFLFIFLIFSVQGSAKTIVKREFTEPLKTSIIIPCAGAHFQHLNVLLQSYEHQTCLPDEVVISLSSTEELNISEIDTMENNAWPFKIKILRTFGKQSAGLNRNIASSHATGDIFIYQDADDIPHPQRVEIVKFLFENYFIVRFLPYFCRFL